jgi:hypothetical protein
MRAAADRCDGERFVTGHRFRFLAPPGGPPQTAGFDAESILNPRCVLRPFRVRSGKNLR